ncbi:uncharacterized protein BX663DRAFT_558959 [Cokeromyces recurvatus]|uniref:uncharacterized protein n=1 Tax=Cokeromyces recurvatus TaxID=90255 RepID=UPI002220EBA8|nr:uncharacterized protein BX663DRAFT_558959 [Cokeromyces recurvatus]KAI7905549.1 hypothetical protein BX663DRAFT_558959 [Cokeromyces recurvatus]
MPNNSPHPNSLSPHSKQATSAFQWPIPPSPSHLKSINNTTYSATSNSNMNEITVKEILDRYSSDPELLKYILTAKSEEDKKKAARDTLKAEEARIIIRQMDLDFAREQVKATARFERQPQQGYVSIPPQQQPTLPPPLPLSQPPTYGPYYGLAPVQQQLLARFHYPSQQGQNNQPSYHHHSHHPPPPSPSVPYPHSAHPLCPPQQPPSHPTNATPTNPPSSSSTSSTSSSSSSSLNSHPNITNNKTTLSATTNEDNHHKKRSRSSISSSTSNNNNEEHQQDKLSHNKVMEALKAKIQRGNGGPPSPLSSSPTNRQQQDTTTSHKKRKSTTVSRPFTLAQQPSERRSTIPSNTTTTTTTSSPRSTKPILPPIDTSLGRKECQVVVAAAAAEAAAAEAEAEAAATATATTTAAVHNDDSSTIIKQENCDTKLTTASPSDHVLLNTRRARSLSPSSSLSPSISTKDDIRKS